MHRRKGICDAFMCPLLPEVVDFIRPSVGVTYLGTLRAPMRRCAARLPVSSLQPLASRYSRGTQRVGRYPSSTHRVPIQCASSTLAVLRRYRHGTASALRVVLTAYSCMRGCACVCSRLRPRRIQHQRLPGGLQDHDGGDVLSRSGVPRDAVRWQCELLRLSERVLPQHRGWICLPQRPPGRRHCP